MAGVKPAKRHVWTYLSNHAHVLIAVAKEPEARVRDLAELVGITERAVLQILADLEASGSIERTREGRRTRYHINPNVPLRHPLEAHRNVSDILRLSH
jgi:DNA-binding MarR family transcriptional regulator